MENVWATMRKPFFVLAPLEDVTDTVFRRVVGSVAAPDLYFTEFTNVDSIGTAGEQTSLKRLVFVKSEKPLIAQIWGLDPEKYFKAAQMIVKAGFDGIDINMGCPEKSVVKKGACSALIKNQKLAKKLIEAVKEGTGGKIPLSVKTRIGFDEIQTEEWIGFLLKQKLDALSIHARTVREESKVPAHWEEIKIISFLRDKISPSTILVGNGDVQSYKDGIAKAKTYRTDGIMVGRGIFHNLELFANKGEFGERPLIYKLGLMKSHIELFEKVWEGKKNYNILKKFYKIYLSNFDKASEIRVRFMETKSAKEALHEIELLEKSL